MFISSFCNPTVISKNENTFIVLLDNYKIPIDIAVKEYVSNNNKYTHTDTLGIRFNILNIPIPIIIKNPKDGR